MFIPSEFKQWLLWTSLKNKLSIGVSPSHLKPSRSLSYHPTQYLRITFNRITTMFFLLAVFHMFAQGFLQSFFFIAILQTKDIATSNLGSTDHNLIPIQTSSTSLRLCSSIPTGLDDEICPVIFPVQVADTSDSARDQCSSILLWVQQMYVPLLILPVFQTA